jgi:hypothetical protein
MMRRLRTVLLVISAMTLVVVGGGAGASALLPTSPSPSLVGQEASEPAGTNFTLGSTVPDPDGGPPWTVRTYPSKTGWTCADVGRTGGTTFGRVDSGDEIHPLELPELGSCADVTKDKFALWVNNYPATADREARAVIFGVVAPEADGVALTIDGTRKELPVTHGAFIDALPASSLAGTVVTVTLADGTTHDTKLRPAPTLVSGG